MTPKLDSAPLVQADESASPQAPQRSMYRVMPPSAMDWLTSSDPGTSASMDWLGGWDACRNYVSTQVRAIESEVAAVAAASPAPTPTGEVMAGDLSHVARLADELDEYAKWIGGGTGMQSCRDTMTASARAIRALLARAVLAAAPPTRPATIAEIRTAMTRSAEDLICAELAHTGLTVAASPPSAVAWEHEFTCPHTKERRRDIFRRPPMDGDLQPGDVVRELVYASLPPAEPAWQPIETAPKDGTCVLIANDSPGSVHPREAYYVAPEHRYENEPTHAGWWRLAGSCEERVHGRTPTHWMPLPPPPVNAGRSIPPAPALNDGELK